MLRTIPYLSIEPGRRAVVADLVQVEGGPTYPPSTRSPTPRSPQRETTLAEAFRGWVDDDIEVVPTETLRGDQSREENRRYNAQLMDTSKLAAATVALRRLGYDGGDPHERHRRSQHRRGHTGGGALELDDVIVAVDGEPVDVMGELRDLLQVGGPGAAHTLTVERPAGSDERVDVPITTIAAPEDPARAVIGIVPEERIVGFDFPVEVTIDSGRVGGPSAGLAFALDDPRRAHAGRAHRREEGRRHGHDRLRRHRRAGRWWRAEGGRCPKCRI